MPDVPNITSARLGSRLRELGLVLPKAPTPLGAYVESNQVGSLLFLSGTLPVVNRKLSISGRLGENLSVEQGREAARLAALNALALAQQHVGDLDRVKKLVKLTVLMVTTEQFVEHPAVADGRGIVAALTLGADAVQIGTAFLACDESGASALHRKLLFQDDAKYTSLSRAFTGRLARGIYHGFASEMKMHEPLFAKYPAHSWIVAPLRAAALAQGRTDLIALWAGQAAPLCRYHKAAELFAALVQETDGILKGRSV